MKCIHGYTFDVSGKALKKPTQIEHHSRKVSNLVVTPILPPEKEPPKEEEEENKSEEADE